MSGKRKDDAALWVGLGCFVVFFCVVLGNSVKNSLSTQQTVSGDSTSNSNLELTNNNDDTYTSAENIAEASPVENEVTEIQPKIKIAMTSDMTAQTESGSKPSAYQPSFLTESIQNCKIKDWGVQFKCDLRWKVDSEKDRLEGAPIILSDDPRVTLTWKKLDSHVHTVGQLNKFFFEELGLYADGIMTERVNFAGHDAVFVKGFDHDSLDTQRRDYYYLVNDKLVSVLFTTSPKERWEEGKSIIQEVKNSFSALP